MPSPTTRTEKLDLRLTRHTKRALQAAAAVAHRSVSEFVLESALSRADEALAGRRTFGLNATQWKAFVAALDAPPRPLPGLERLMKEPHSSTRPQPDQLKTRFRPRMRASSHRIAARAIIRCVHRQSLRQPGAVL